MSTVELSTVTKETAPFKGQTWRLNTSPCISAKQHINSSPNPHVQAPTTLKWKNASILFLTNSDEASSSVFGSAVDQLIYRRTHWIERSLLPRPGSHPYASSSLKLPMGPWPVLTHRCALGSAITGGTVCTVARVLTREDMNIDFAFFSSVRAA